MNQSGASQTDPTSKLSLAIRDVKNASADREDVVVEMREASRMRLELLAQELAEVFEAVPDDNPQFDFAISSGLQPRLWIDATAHVAMGRDKRVYRFVRDTRMGRVVLAESTDMKPVADQVTRYIAERIVERQRLLEGVGHPLVERADMVGDEGPDATRQASGRAGVVFTALTMLLIGAALGVAAMLAWLWDKIPPAVTP
jgi:hypothetical protein